MQAHLIMKWRVCGWVWSYVSVSRRVLWSMWWKDARHRKVDLIRGIWNVFKKWITPRRDTDSSSGGGGGGGIRHSRSKWAAGRHGACRAAKYSQQHMNGRPDYFVTNDSLARACTRAVRIPLGTTRRHTHWFLSRVSLQKFSAKTLWARAKTSSDALTCGIAQLPISKPSPPPTAWCLILRGPFFILKHNQKRIPSPLWLLVGRAEQKFATNLSQPEECNFQDRDGKWLEWEGWSPQWRSAAQKTASRHLREEKKMQSALIVQSQHERRRRELLQRRTARGDTHTERHKFRRRHTNPFAYELHQQKKRRGVWGGGSQKLVYMQISLHWGDEKQQIHGKTLVLFLPSD